MLLTQYNNGLLKKRNIATNSLKWQGSKNLLITETKAIYHHLLQLENQYYLVQTDEGIALARDGEYSTNGYDCLGFLPPVKTEWLGDEQFKKAHQTNFAYYAGAMATGIASAEMLIALGKQGYLGSFGAGGLPLTEVEAAIEKIQSALGNAGPYAFNLIHSPSDPQLEKNCLDLYLKYGIRSIEASAFMGLSPNLVHYRASGLSRRDNGEIIEQNHLILKTSRREVAEPYLEPAPESVLNQLVAQNAITAEQAYLARHVPIATDITVEADSAGHTDNRPLVCLLPFIQEIRNRLQREWGYGKPVRVGAAGGLGTPNSIAAALAMGADYVVTGSVNQACVESATSFQVKQLLAQIDMADVMMAPAPDMFEIGVKVQVLKRGTFCPLRGQKLYEIYRKYNSIEEISPSERQQLEQQIFQKDLSLVWNDTVEFFSRRNPSQLEKAEKNPKYKMALIFRWYLGKSSSWAKAGLSDRQMDYQVWCGPAMGAFNEWTKGSYLEKPENRHIVDVTGHLLRGAAYCSRLRLLETLGIALSQELSTYHPNR